jgi:threonine dehydratase
LTGARVFLKCEIFQRTGSFKFRGAFNRIALIPPAERAGGVVAFSSGNHAQGVASAAKLFDMPAVIVMPADAPRPKIEGTRALGAQIVLYDRLHDDREAIATRIGRERGATLIKPFDDPAIIAGQGTVGLEIAEDAARLGAVLDQVLVPCSGGGLVSGTALGLSGGAPVKVHSVEPENYDGMRRSLVAGRRVAAPGGALSIADALMAPVPGLHVFELAKPLLAEGLVVSDEELERAVAFAATRLKLMVEPGGAAGLAALLAGKAPKVKTLALVLSGGNAGFDAVAAMVARWETKLPA